MNPFDLMKNMKQIQERLADFQAKVSEMKVQGEAGGGMVKVTIDGNMRTLDVFIDPVVVNPDDIAFLQDLVTAAMNDAHRKMKDQLAAGMAQITGGMNIPPGMFGL